jgi:hypothetical protein
MPNIASGIWARLAELDDDKSLRNPQRNDCENEADESRLLQHPDLLPSIVRIPDITLDHPRYSQL